MRWNIETRWSDLRCICMECLKFAFISKTKHESNQPGRQATLLMLDVVKSERCSRELLKDIEESKKKLNIYMTLL